MIGYGNVGSAGDRPQDELIRDNIDLVKRIAHHLSARLPSSIEIDDLFQSGMIGLLEAAGNFDAGKGASFETYAGIRIRGAMLDEVRKIDWAPRSVYRKQREVSNMIRSIEGEKGRPAEGHEVAERLQISLDEYHSILRDTTGCRLFSLDETLDEPGFGKELPCSKTATPDEVHHQNEFRKELMTAIEGLPEREKMVLSLYYEKELNLKEIGVVLGVSESRVCQIHGQALLRLRSIVET